MAFNEFKQKGKLRVGVVGAGEWGECHARTYQSMADVELVGVVDIDACTAHSMAKKYACAAFTDLTGLLGQVDAVSVVVPTIMHLEVSRPFLECGVHVLVEKPIAHTCEQALEMVELAERSAALLQVGHLERFNAGVVALADRISDPRFVEVHRLGPFAERAMDVDVVMDLMIHDIDIVLTLVGSPIDRVDAMGIPVLSEHLDIANARLRFSNGAVANITASRVSKQKLRRIRVFERDGYYGLNYINQQLDIVTRKPSTAGQRAEIVTHRLDIKAKSPLEAELQSFVRSVRQGIPPLVSGRVGLEAVRVAMLIKESIKQCNQ